MPERYDAVIAGGGLAGLTLARQLHLEAPELRVLVLEKRRHPVPEAAFKVGESSVEIAAHYFETILGLGAHIRAQQLDKLGLRYFFTHADNRDIASRIEVGPPCFPPVPSFQLDRGRLENVLLAELRQAGVEVEDGCPVHRLDLGPGRHRVTFGRTGEHRSVDTGFVVDASGRTGLLRRQLGLTRPVGHDVNACWFRIRTRVRVDDWSDDPAWRAKVPSGERWLSTNHLMGRGYWVWLIPLGSGGTSVGIVADDAIHPYASISRFDRALAWLWQHEPQCAAIVERLADEREDFLALKHYAHGSARVLSPDGWATIGEAGAFTDPFYSPGSDFIAIGNDCVADLIVRRCRGEDVAARTEAFNTTYLRLFDAFLRVYQGQYPLMGNAQVMTAKAAWDNACYWAITALLYVQRRYREPAFMAAIEPLMRRFFVLHARMQQCFRAWDLADTQEYAAAFTNVTFVPELFALQAGLGDPPADDETLRGRLEANFAILERMACAWQSQAAAVDPSLARFVAEGDSLDITPLVLRPLPVTV
jgi:flavin-dependent dehydrogenase